MLTLNNEARIALKYLLNTINSDEAVLRFIAERIADRAATNSGLPKNMIEEYIYLFTEEIRDQLDQRI